MNTVDNQDYQDLSRAPFEFLLGKDFLEDSQKRSLYEEVNTALAAFVVDNHLSSKSVEAVEVFTNELLQADSPQKQQHVLLHHGFPKDQASLQRSVEQFKKDLVQARIEILDLEVGALLQRKSLTTKQLDYSKRFSMLLSQVTDRINHNDWNTILALLPSINAYEQKLQSFGELSA